MTLELRPVRAGMHAPMCDWYGCDPAYRDGKPRKPVRHRVFLMGQPAGCACTPHAKQLRAVWDGAHDEPEMLEAVA